MKKLETALLGAGFFLVTPVLIGLLGNIIASAYSGTGWGGTWLLGMGLLSAAWIVGKVADRKNKGDE